MFERFCDPAKRAIFFARFLALAEDAPDIDSVNLLRGLMYGQDSRVNAVFRLHELFPNCRGCPGKFSNYKDLRQRDIPLDWDARRIVGRAAAEADGLGDHWIDTEHLLLAIMAHGKSPAAGYLAIAGLNLQEARIKVFENKATRPDYGRVPVLSRMRYPVETLMMKLRVWNYRRRTS